MKKLKTMLATIMLVCTAAPGAWAMNRASAGSFGYEIYDFIANDLLSGAVGGAILLGIIAYGAYFVLRSSVFGAITCAIAALIVVKAEDITISLGAMIGM